MTIYPWLILVVGVLFSIAILGLFHYWAIKPLVRKQVSRWNILVAVMYGVLFYYVISWCTSDLTMSSTAAQLLVDSLPLPFAYLGGLGWLIFRGFGVKERENV